MNWVSEKPTCIVWSNTLSIPMHGIILVIFVINQSLKAFFAPYQLCSLIGEPTHGYNGFPCRLTGRIVGSFAILICTSVIVIFKSNYINTNCGR